MDHNSFNAQVYSTNSSGVADFLVANKEVQIALKYWIEELVADSDPIKILELGTGKRSLRWRQIASLPTNRNYRVTLSDFAYDALPSQATLPHHPQFIFRLSQLNLLKDQFPIGTFDVVLASYVFDSIWFKEDQYLNRMHYPGGLIAKVQEAFSTCLGPTGVFISIDRTSTRFVPEYETSGPARFKTENYIFAADALRASGFAVQLLTLNDFLTSANVQVPLDLSDHSCLIVTRS